MDVGEVMQAVADRADTIAELRCFGHPVDGTPPIPALIVDYPDIAFDQTYGRGMDRFTLPVVVLVGRVWARTTRANFAKWFNGSGPESVKAVLESGTYTAFHTIRVTSLDVDVVRLGTVDYLAGTLTLDITGQGS